MVKVICDICHNEIPLRKDRRKIAISNADGNVCGFFGEACDAIGVIDDVCFSCAQKVFDYIKELHERRENI